MSRHTPQLLLDKRAEKVPEMVQDERNDDEIPRYQNIKVVPLQEGYELLPTLWRWHGARAEVLQQGVPKHGNRNRPNSHAPNTQRVNLINRLREEPHTKNNREQKANLEPPPEPAPQRSASQQHDAQCCHNRKANHTQKWIWNIPECRGLL